MSRLLEISHTIFENAMKENYEMDQNITAVDIFETFVHALSKETNVLSGEKLKGLVFRQFKDYGDFDETVKQVSSSVSDIKKSTQDAMLAIDNQDTSALKSAYNQLKTYQERILKLEEDMYTDDMTGVYNRKYLFNHELDEGEKFKTNGTLIHISINNFLTINKEHGHESGDIVIKYISKLLQKNLRSMGIHFIRYIGVEFVAVAKDTVSAKAMDTCEQAVALILSKTFKTKSGEILHIDLKVDSVDYKEGQNFQELFETL